MFRVNGLKLSLFSCCLFFLQSMSVTGSQLAGSGDILQMLKKIQGRWQTECFAVASGAGANYRQEVLKFSFTHVRFEVTEYANANCVQKRSQHSTTYPFVLAGMLQSSDGQSVYAIDFNDSDNPTPYTFLPPRNIIRYASGQLLLGLSSVGGDEAPLDRSNRRLMRLDDRKPFTR